MTWDELRGGMMRDARGPSVTGGRAASLRRWLRKCAADPTCTVREGAARPLAHKRGADSNTTPPPEWLTLRESLLGDPAEGEDSPPPDHPGWAAADRIAAARGTSREPRSLAAELLAEIKV
jgi:hypothetical protein